jgi:uncharacterized protein
MDDLGIAKLSIFVAATFAASLVAGLAGFAFALIAAAAWLHVLTPTQSTALIAAFGLIVQGVSVWNLRRALNLPRLLPFLIGAALGVPIGIALLEVVATTTVRVIVGVLLVAFSLYSLLQPKLPQVGAAGKLADGAVGALNGSIGGMTGLAGIAAVVWCLLRGWSKDEQRAVFQPLAVFIFALTALVLGATGALTAQIGMLFALGLPALLAGTWLGLQLYGKIDEASFRKIVLVLLLASGVSLLL